jgi:hypothetical protein
MHPPESAREEETVIADAAAAGFELVQYDTDTGQTVWEWRRGLEPRPQFVTRRIAIHWMTELLPREGAVAFVSDTGLSYAQHAPERRRDADHSEWSTEWARKSSARLSPAPQSFT